ncbi:MAG: hypothetical protein KTR14_10485 [Vampirovibrio sp.]|nr:hypothetical protein [Vampirovibrio sp.]
MMKLIEAISDLRLSNIQRMGGWLMVMLLLLSPTVEAKKSISGVDLDTSHVQKIYLKKEVFGGDKKSSLKLLNDSLHQIQEDTGCAMEWREAPAAGPGLQATDLPGKTEAQPRLMLEVDIPLPSPPACIQRLKELGGE